MMEDKARLTFLGSGTSQGIPMIGCDCPVCSSADPRDKRLRASVLVEYKGLSVPIDFFHRRFSLFEKDARNYINYRQQCPPTHHLAFKTYLSPIALTSSHCSSVKSLRAFSNLTATLKDAP